MLLYSCRWRDFALEWTTGAELASNKGNTKFSGRFTAQPWAKKAPKTKCMKTMACIMYLISEDDCFATSRLVVLMGFAMIVLYSYSLQHWPDYEAPVISQSRSPNTT